MDFSWSQEQTELRERAIEMARRELNEGLAERDAAGVFNRSGWKLCGQFGIQGLPMPEAYGGGGFDPLTTVGVLESLGYGCRDNGLVFSLNAHMWTAEIPILHFGNEEQKQRYLPGLCSGELIGGNAMTEPDSGSDAYSLSTTAERRGDRYVLNGSKCFVTNAPVADLLVVYANADPTRGPRGISAFLVEKDAPGFSCTESHEKMGIRTSPIGEVYLDDCEVPVENRLGREGAGRSLFNASMTWERACILASAVGSMQRLLESCIRHASERRQFGQPIGKNQLIQTRIVDMKLRVETARALLYHAAWLRGRGRSIFLEAALAKLHISESWVQSAQDAIQIHGGYGYMRGYEVERELRDAIASRIYSGTSEIQRAIIASLLGL
jgi:alkylation response protein AidB-like acyl-CoA dehydrogenase